MSKRALTNTTFDDVYRPIRTIRARLESIRNVNGSHAILACAIACNA